jgi:hypothetical protein
MRLLSMRLILVCLLSGILIVTASFNPAPVGAGAATLLHGGPTPTVSPLVLKTAAEQLSEFLADPPPPILLADCTPGDGFVRCQDHVLALDFAYPAFFGSLIETQLRAGGLEGVAYEYRFADGRMGAAAGGRSHVFGEPRGGMVTDQMGFGNYTGAQLCAERSYASCREVKPGVLLTVVAFEGQYLCPMGMSRTVMEAEVLINLPHHLAVNGFGFFTPLLSPEEEQGMLGPLDLDSIDQQCDAETLAAYDRDRLALVRALEAGTAPRDIQARYDAMLRLAQSITGPYVSDDFYAPPPPLANLQCNTTLPNGSTPPAERPSLHHHGNGLLWTELPLGGVILITDDSQVRPDGAYAVDFPWWRKDRRNSLQIGSSGPSIYDGVQLEIPMGYDDADFLPSTLLFPALGCWHITAQAGAATLSFVVELKDARAQ